MSDAVKTGRPEAAATIWSWQGETASANDRARALRKSGVVRGVVGWLIGSAFLYFDRWIVGSIAIGLGTLTLVLALVSPTGAYAALSRGVDRVGELVGLALTWLLLTPVFFFFFVPFGLIARRGARDRMGRTLERSHATYWKTRAPEAPGSIEKPY